MATTQSSSTLYVPIVSPPTPAPSPRLAAFEPPSISDRISDPAALSRRDFAALPPPLRFQYLSAIIADCSPSELLFISTTITPLLKRDLLRDLPPEISLHILSYLQDAQTLTRASRVSRSWNRLLQDQWLWKRMCHIHGYSPLNDEVVEHRRRAISDEAEPISDANSRSLATNSSVLGLQPHPVIHSTTISYRGYFKYAHSITTNWLKGGRLLRTHRIPLVPSSQMITAPNTQAAAPSAIPTSVALDDTWVVVGLANSRIHVFSSRTGVLSRTLVGHESGVWAVALVKGAAESSDRCSDEMEVNDNGDPEKVLPAPDHAGQATHSDPPMPSTLRRALGLDIASPRSAKYSYRKSASDLFRSRSNKGVERHVTTDKPSDPAGASDGWGQPNALVISGGCDKDLRVWDVKSGYCIYILQGHTSTIRCLKVLHGQPIAVSGSRDRTLRVWDVQRGQLLRVLEGHEQSVRCLDVCGSRVVSGSYDCTCRVWDVDTGACLHVLRGHFHQIYSVAFDGVRIASGGLDTTVRVWDAASGTCLALLQGHTALVCQLQLSPTMLATGGSDGRVITFSLKSSFSVIQRLAAHDSSVTGLQLDGRFLVTSGNDGRVRLYKFQHGTGVCDYIRELSEPSESVWKVAYTRETCAVMCKRGGKTVMEIWSFKPNDDL